MRLFRWQQLRFLILVQLLESNITPKFKVEALLVYENSISRSWHFRGRIGKYSCLRQPVVVSSKIEPDVAGTSYVPTLTPLQETETETNKPRKHKLATVIGVISATLLVLIIGLSVFICLMRVKRSIQQNPPSSSASPPDGVNAEDFSDNTQILRKLDILELEQATNKFCHNNIIGEGLFGVVYKGLLQDGSIVVVKRRLHRPNKSLVDEIKYIAQVTYKHLVKLIGFYEDSHQQMLVYDYIHNGNAGQHLYSREGLPIERLNMQQRLLIATGAAKGLEHLHSQVPPLLHMHFRTSNVLVDENFTAKVSDFGLSTLVDEGYRAGSSSTIDYFLDPDVTGLTSRLMLSEPLAGVELKKLESHTYTSFFCSRISTSKAYSRQSDVYSFGIFLLELISGYEARDRPSLVIEAKSYEDTTSFFDKAIGDDAMHVAKEIMKLAVQCIDITTSRRPSMKKVVEELENIVEREFSHFHEEIGPVKLGSELFMSTL